MAEAISDEGFELHVWARRAQSFDAKNLGIDIRRLYDVITVSSGSSAVLQSVGSQIDSKAAVHIQALMRKDIEHFANAMCARGLDPSSVRDRGLGGADGVLELAQWIEGGATGS
jgi:hypothetical protein